MADNGVQVKNSLLKDLTLGVLRKAVHLLTSDRPVEPALEAVLKRIMGTHDQALLLERLLYWSQKAAAAGRDEIYASSARWQEECEVSRATVQRAKTAMRAFVDIQTKTIDYGRVDHYRLNVQKFLHRFAEALAVAADRVIAVVQQIIADEKAAAEGSSQFETMGDVNLKPRVISKSDDGSSQIEQTGGIKLRHKTDSIYTDSFQRSDPPSPPLTGGGGLPSSSSDFEKLISVLGSGFPGTDASGALTAAMIGAAQGRVRSPVAYAAGILRREQREMAARPAAISGGQALSRDAFVTDL